MIRGLALGAALAISLLLLFGGDALAETVSVTLTADEINYDYHSKQIEAKGNVQISYKKTKVRSDQAVIDHDQNILLATGHVKVEKEGDLFDGDRFLYYLETQQGWVYPVITEITDAEIEGSLKYTATEAFIKGEEILFKKAYLTSCDLEHPHYHFTAKEVEYFPEDKIKMRHVWYWEHRVPLIYVPVLFISLEEDSNNFGMQVGWNNTDGWWVSAWYTYYFGDDNSLMVRNKTTEHGIDYWEFEHINKLSPTRKLSQTFEIEDKDKIGNYNDDYKFGLKYEDRTNPKMNYETWINAWKRYTIKGDNYYDGEFVLNFKGQSPYPAIKYYYDIKGEQVLPEMYLYESWKYNIDPSFNISLNGEWLYSERRLDGGQPSNKMDYYFNLLKKWKQSDLSIKTSEKNIGVNESIVPDITYTIYKWDAPLVGEIKTTSQYTHKETVKTNTNVKTEGDRAAVDLQKINNLWEKGNVTLSNDIQFRFRDYIINDSPSEVEALTESLVIKNMFTNELNTEIKLGFTEVQGETNQFFTSSDDIRPGAEIRNYWNWKSRIFSANFNTGYNFETEYAYPAYLGATWTPNSTSVGFGTVYYWDNGPGENFGFGATRLTVNSSPRKDWQIILLLNYDFTTQLWSQKRMDLELTEQLSPKWKANLRMNYNMLIDDFTNANVGLAYDWHCRTLEMHYDWVEREYWLQFTFKAFPQARFNTSENPLEYLNYE